MSVSSMLWMPCDKAFAKATSGAWGLALFESDDEFEHAGELAAQFPGLVRLEDKAYASWQPPKPKAGEKLSEEEKRGPFYTIIAKQPSRTLMPRFPSECTDVAVVRDHLDNGALQFLINKYVAKWRGKKQDGEPRPIGYTLVFLGMCAMTLGCKIPADFKALLKKLYLHVNLMPLAVKQAEVALGPNGYKDGEPYDFFALDVVKNGPEPPRISPLSLNVWGKGTVKEPRVPAPRFPAGVCGGCGTTQGEEGALLTCKKCKKRHYCSKECQRIHWDMHKITCKAPTTTD